MNTKIATIRQLKNFTLEDDYLDYSKPVPWELKNRAFAPLVANQLYIFKPFHVIDDFIPVYTNIYDVRIQNTARAFTKNKLINNNIFYVIGSNKYEACILTENGICYINHYFYMNELDLIK